MYFDGAAHKEGVRARVFFIMLEGEMLLCSFTLIVHSSNNIVEYQALILGLKIAADMKQLKVNIYGDSKLIVNQIFGIYEVKKLELVLHNSYEGMLMSNGYGMLQLSTYQGSRTSKLTL